MTNWLKAICNVLEKPKYKQIQGNLQQMEDGKIIGKCALGELKCARRVKQTDITDDGSIIMMAYKVPNDLTDRELPKMDNLGKGTPIEGFIFREPTVSYDRIQDYIWKMNDSGMTYEQIITFLKVTFGDEV